MTTAVEYHAERSWHFLELVDDEVDGVSWKKPATRCGARLLMRSRRLPSVADGRTGRTETLRMLCCA